MKTVRLDPDFIKVRHPKGFRICVMCGEAYPLTDGAICRGCQGDAPFAPLETPLAETALGQPDFIHEVPVEDKFIPIIRNKARTWAAVWRTP